MYKHPNTKNVYTLKAYIPNKIMLELNFLQSTSNYWMLLEYPIFAYFIAIFPLNTKK